VDTHLLQCRKIHSSGSAMGQLPLRWRAFASDGGGRPHGRSLPS
jgi:hypothetical protein